MPVTAIYSTKTLVDGALRSATVVMDDGIIKAVLDGYASEYSHCLVDAGNLVVMPGVIDPHVHINEPGRESWEGFYTATKAAIAGGVTSLVEMPLNASPVTTSVSAFHQKLDAAKDKLHCNCGFWGGIVPGNAAEIVPMAEAGVLGYKAFLTHSGIDEFPNVTEADLDIAMPLIASTGFPLLVHCELSDGDVVIENRDAGSYYQYLASRPKYWEDDAIAMKIRLCRKHGCRVHIVHLSSAGSIAQIEEAKASGLPITVETAQHYLYVNAEEIPDGNTAYKCAPPIREKANNDLLWQALKDGIIDFVATDHSPAPPEMKKVETGDLQSAWGGIASIQFALSALWTAGRLRNVSLPDTARWLCENPAKLAGLEKNKGRIAVGYHADIIVWDPEASFNLQPALIHHRHKLTPYLGNTLYGVVKQVFVAGREVYHQPEFISLANGALLLNAKANANKKVAS